MCLSSSARLPSNSPIPRLPNPPTPNSRTPLQPSSLPIPQFTNSPAPRSSIPPNFPGPAAPAGRGRWPGKLANWRIRARHPRATSRGAVHSCLCLWRFCSVGSSGPIARAPFAVRRTMAPLIRGRGPPSGPNPKKKRAWRAWPTARTYFLLVLAIGVVAAAVPNWCAGVARVGSAAEVNIYENSPVLRLGEALGPLIPPQT